MKLYNFDLSGNCYKIRLMLSLLGLPYEQKNMDLAAKEQKSEHFLSLNSKGEIPVLQDGNETIVDSNAILVYLATQYDQGHYLPPKPAIQAQIQFWLATAANEVQHGIAAARLVKVFAAPLDYDSAVAKGTALLGMLDGYLAGHDWLASDHTTIADIAIYPYVALAEDGGISLAPYQHIQQWFTRLEALPAYIPLPQASGTA